MSKSTGTSVAVVEAVEVEAVTEVTVHLDAVTTEVTKRTNALVKVLRTQDGKLMDAVYGVNGVDGLIVWVNKFLLAGGKLNAVAEPGTTAYTTLSDIKRVIGRFGVNKPARFTAWGAVKAAIKLDVIPDGVGDLKLDDVRKAVAEEAKAKKSLTASGNGNASAVTVEVDAPTLLCAALVELATRVENGETFTEEQVASILRSADLIIAKLG